jgi:hypothetical protein
MDTITRKNKAIPQPNKYVKNDKRDNYNVPNTNMPNFFEKEYSRKYNKRDDEFMEKTIKNKFVILSNSNITKLRDFMNEIKKKFKSNCEFELRFQNINKTQFESLSNSIEEFGLFKKKSITKFITKITKDNIRVHTDINHNVLYREYKKETDKLFLNLSNNKVKFSLSYENILEPNTQYVDIVLERYKERTRYEFNDYYIDMTIVNDNLSEKIYEIEIEFKTIPEINQFLLPVKYVLFIINKHRLSLIDIDYEYEIRNLYQNLIKNITNSKLKHAFSIYENKPRNLKLEDIKKDKFNYSITNKLNGVNFFLYYSKEKEKMFMFNKTKFEYIHLSVESDFHIENDFLIQGELYEEPTIEKKILYIFDTIFLNGKSMINLYHPERISEFEKYKNAFDKMLVNSPIKIKMKDFYGIEKQKEPLNLYDEFIKCKNSLQTINGSLDYEINDGFIFTPTDEPYINTNTLKYKFPETMTIDFLIKLQNKSGNFKVFNLFVYNNRNEIVPFEPTGHPNEYNNRKYIMISEKSRDGILFNSLKDDMIVECKLERTDTGNDNFIPYRIRDDKTMPNFVDVANDVFRDILNPITLSEIEKTLKNIYNPIVNEKLEEIKSPRINLEYYSLLECIFSNISDVYINSDKDNQIRILNSAYEYFDEDDEKTNDIKLLATTFKVNMFHLTQVSNDEPFENLFDEQFGELYILEKYITDISNPNIYFL